MRKDAFSAYHPLVNFLYFSLVLLFTMFFMHPVSLLISLASALSYAARLNGKKTLRLSLRALLPLMLFTCLVGAAFQHEGASILCYLPGGNPLTLESIGYSAASSLMLCSVIVWFTCYSAVVSSDKFIYLFGRVIPALSLVLSMTLRFVPRFHRQFLTVSEAQRAMGRDVSRGSVRERIKNAAAILSIMVTWSLENAIETADSMKSRGYGLPGRSAFSIYRITPRDKAALLWLAFCGVYILAGAAAGCLRWQYYPTMQGAMSGAALSFQLAYLALCLTPLILNEKEDRKWKHLRSKT